mgnify:CR=1 FL=1
MPTLAHSVRMSFALRAFNFFIVGIIVITFAFLVWSDNQHTFETYYRVLVGNIQCNIFCFIANHVKCLNLNSKRADDRTSEASEGESSN